MGLELWIPDGSAKATGHELDIFGKLHNRFFQGVNVKGKIMKYCTFMLIVLKKNVWTVGD
mgnify:CR=1 FL=1